MASVSIHDFVLIVSSVMPNKLVIIRTLIEALFFKLFHLGGDVELLVSVCIVFVLNFLDG
jgi:hypothetical protein